MPENISTTLWEVACELSKIIGQEGYGHYIIVSNYTGETKSLEFKMPYYSPRGKQIIITNQLLLY